MYVFRDFLGVTHTYDKSFRTKKDFETEIHHNHPKSRVKPISFMETTFNPYVIGKVIPNTALDKWFDEKSIQDVAKRLFNINNASQVPLILFEINNKMNDIVERVDRDLVRNISIFLDRIKSRLLYDP